MQTVDESSKGGQLDLRALWAATDLDGRHLIVVLPVVVVIRPLDAAAQCEATSYDNCVCAPTVVFMTIYGHEAEAQVAALFRIAVKQRDFLLTRRIDKFLIKCSRAIVE